MDPTTLTAGLTLLIGDQADVTAKTTAKTQSAATVVADQQIDDKNAHDLTASQGKIATDLAAYKAELDLAFGPAVVPPVPTPV
jgi:hypothetical protein